MSKYYEDYDAYDLDYTDGEEDPGKCIPFILSGESPKAWCIHVKGQRIWVPKSVCDLNLDKTKIQIPGWLCSKHNI